MTPEIRLVRDEELAAYVDAMTTGFLQRPDVDKVAEDVRTLWDLGRVLGAFDDDGVCGTFRSWATELTVPGGAQLPAAAVASVTVLPTHRRRGILRAMMAAGHGAIRERGEAVGLLHASEYPIYGRFGYGPGALEATWTLETSGLRFHTDAAGSVEMTRPGPEARDAIKGVFEAWRLVQPGELRRRDLRWEVDLGLREIAWGDQWKGYLVLHRDPAGTVDGYARYHADGKWEHGQPRNTIQVDDLHALTADAYSGLWRFLAGVDWVATVVAERRGPAERLPWLLENGRAARVSDVGDGLWVRLFDVPRALEARTYERRGSVVLEVVDPEAPGGRTRVHLDGGPDGATCSATSRSPDLTVHIAALSAAYLGGPRLRDAVLAAGADEHSEGALAETDALFRTLDEPWCSTFF